MSKYLFIDVDTQKCFVEHFGERAIADCPEIRENLMTLTHAARVNNIPIAAFMYEGTDFCVPGSNDHMKLSDTDLEGQNRFTHTDFENLISSKFQEFLSDSEFKSAFVYGVPLESSVKNLCKVLIGKIDKIWLVQDAVKATDGNENELVEELKQLGVKIITTRNLQSFVAL